MSEPSTKSFSLLRNLCLVFAVGNVGFVLLSEWTGSKIAIQAFYLWFFAASVAAVWVSWPRRLAALLAVALSGMVSINIAGIILKVVHHFAPGWPPGWQG